MDMEKIVSLAKQRGFIYPGSSIYGGLANSWDYGPLGAQLRMNIKRSWWKAVVESRPDMLGLDGAIMMNPKVWKASGHVDTFNDPLVECNNCHSRYRVDQLVSKPELFNQIRKDTRVIAKEYTAKARGLIDDRQLIINLKAKVNLIFPDLTQEQKDSLVKYLDEQFKIKGKEAEESIEQSEYALSEYEKALQYLGFLTQYYLNRYESCEKCDVRDWTMPRAFNLMFKTFIGSASDTAEPVYLRPETAQAMFVNFKNVLNSLRPRLPFGLAQIGKAFRNEITPGNFIFRTLEFEQMEIEYFVEPETWETHFDQWKQWMLQWGKQIGLDLTKMHELEVPAEERAHYSKRTVDFEFDFPFGRKELWGLAYRGDFDLSNHANASGENLEYTDPMDPKRKFLPHVVEPTQGVDRTLLALLVSAYAEEEVNGETRTVLRFTPEMAPYQVAVLPLSKKPELEAVSNPLYMELIKKFRCEYDVTQSIGKRYRRQDEIGTPFCITVDFDSLNDQQVTIRERDSMQQVRLPLNQVTSYLHEHGL